MFEPLNSDQEERAVCALEAIAEALTLWCKLEAQKFDKQYPVKPEARDATITRIKTDEDRARASLGGDPSESLDEWTSPGAFERRFDENSRKGSKRKNTTAKE